MKDTDTLLQQAETTIATRHKDRSGQVNVDATRIEEQEVECKGEGGHNEMERRRNDKDGRHNERRGRSVTRVREKR